MEINKALSVGLESPDFNGLSPEITTSLFNKIKATDIIPNIGETFIFRRCTWIKYLDYQRKHILRQLDVLEPYISHLEPELVSLLNQYRNCTLYLVLDMHLEEEENLSVIGKYYSEYSLMGKNLYEYVKKSP